MTGMMKSVMVIGAGFWAGGLFWIGFVFAPYLFTLASNESRLVPHSGVAAELIGPLLYGSDVVGLIVVGFLLVGLFLLRKRSELPIGGRFFVCEISLVVSTFCVAINYWGLSPRLNRVQDILADRYGGFHLADSDDPLLTHFSWLHEMSFGLFMITFAAALICLICISQFRPHVVR